MKKMWLLTLLLALPLVSAQGPLEVIGGVWNKVLSVGSLSFIGVSGLVPFTRILIWILTFALFFSVASWLSVGKDKTPLFKRNQAMVVSAVLATISAIFLPAAAILAVGTGWATAVGLILIGAPIVGLGYVLWNIPGKDEKTGKSMETKGTVLLKLLISLLLFWVLSAMNNEVKIVGPTRDAAATVAGTMANFLAWALYIASIMIIYYIVKFFLTSSESSEEKEKRWQEGGAALRKAIKDKMEARKAGEEMGRRAQGVKEPQSYLVNAVEDCDGLLNALYRSTRTSEERKAAVGKAEKHLKNLKKNLKKAVRSLRYLRRKEKGEIYEFFDKLYSYAGAALSRARNISLPKPDSGNWERELAVIHGQVKGPQGIRGICGTIIKHLDGFVEHQKTQFEAAQRAEQQAEERAEQQQQRQEAAQQRTQEQAKTQEQAQPRRKVLKSRVTGVARPASRRSK